MGNLHTCSSHIESSGGITSVRNKLMGEEGYLVEGENADPHKTFISH